MRLGWAKKDNSISYYVHKTIRVDGKNKSLAVRRLGSEKYICETYGVTDAKAWAKEQVRLMNEAEQGDGPEDIIKVNRRRWEIEECFLVMKLLLTLFSPIIVVFRYIHLTPEADC